MSGPKKSADIPDVTGSPELRDGITPSVSPAGPPTDLFGVVPARASRSVQRAKAKGKKIRAISGPCSFGSSESAALQRSLANSLRAILGDSGSPECEVTWKRWAMPSGAPICALRARVRPTSDSAYSGWPTPVVPNGGRRPKGGTMSPTGRTPDGKKRQVDVEFIARLAIWPTPDTGHSLTGHGRRGGRPGNGRQSGQDVERTALLAIWATPTAIGATGSQTHRSGKRSNELLLEGQAKSALPSGTTTTLSTSEGENRGVLSAEHFRWLMGYPAAWLSCVDWATLSSRKSRRRS